MIFSHSIIVFLLTTVTFSAWADLKCIDFFSNTSKVPKTLEEVQSYQEALFSKWNPLLGPFAIEGVRVMLDGQSHFLESAFYDSRLNTIALGMTLPGQTFEVLGPVQAHEYGHAIFNHHFSLKIQGEKYALIDYVKKTRQPKTSAQAQEELERFLRQLVHYNEFFSDVVAVALYRDPHVMSSIMNLDKLQNTPQKKLLMKELRNRPKGSAPPRDFATFPFRLWNKSINDPYAVFDPLRGVLWNLYIRNLPTSEIPLLIDVLLKSISEHAELRFSRGERMTSIEPPQTAANLNRELLLIFKKRADASGLIIRKKDIGGPDRD